MQGAMQPWHQWQTTVKFTKRMCVSFMTEQNELPKAVDDSHLSASQSVLGHRKTHWSTGFYDLTMWSKLPVCYKISRTLQYCWACKLQIFGIGFKDISTPLCSNAQISCASTSSPSPLKALQLRRLCSQAWAALIPLAKIDERYICLWRSRWSREEGTQE